MATWKQMMSGSELERSRIALCDRLFLPRSVDDYNLIIVLHATGLNAKSDIVSIIGWAGADGFKAAIYYLLSEDARCQDLPAQSTVTNSGSDAPVVETANDD